MDQELDRIYNQWNNNMTSLHSKVDELNKITTAMTIHKDKAKSFTQQDFLIIQKQKETLFDTMDEITKYYEELKKNIESLELNLQKVD